MQRRTTTIYKSESEIGLIESAFRFSPFFVSLSPRCSLLRLLFPVRFWVLLLFWFGVGLDNFSLLTKDSLCADLDYDAVCVAPCRRVECSLCLASVRRFSALPHEYPNRYETCLSMAILPDTIPSTTPVGATIPTVPAFVSAILCVQKLILN